MLLTGSLVLFLTLLCLLCHSCWTTQWMHAMSSLVAGNNAQVSNASCHIGLPHRFVNNTALGTKIFISLGHLPLHASLFLGLLSFIGFFGAIMPLPLPHHSERDPPAVQVRVERTLTPTTDGSVHASTSHVFSITGSNHNTQLPTFTASFASN